jgi:hypothetical protein
MSQRAGTGQLGALPVGCWTACSAASDVSGSLKRYRRAYINLKVSGRARELELGSLERYQLDAEQLVALPVIYRVA